MARYRQTLPRLCWGIECAVAAMPSEMRWYRERLRPLVLMDKEGAFDSWVNASEGVYYAFSEAL